MRQRMRERRRLAGLPTPDSGHGRLGAAFDYRQTGRDGGLLFQGPIGGSAIASMLLGLWLFFQRVDGIILVAGGVAVVRHLRSVVQREKNKST